MKKLLALSVLVFAGTLALQLWGLPGDVDLVKVYQEKLQIPLFTGFLTIGGFLLSLKTFILVKLREDLYELDAYEARLKEQRLVRPDLSKYGPLRRLGEFLVYSVAGALGTALLQVTVGFVSSRVAAAVCISSAAMTGALVLMAWWLIRQNLRDWFDLLEEEARNKGV